MIFSSSHIGFVLCIRSGPIIEDCTDVFVAPAKSESKKPETRRFENLWHDVQDFKWLRKERSPNWAVLPHAEELPRHEEGELGESESEEELRALRIWVAQNSATDAVGVRRRTAVGGGAAVLGEMSHCAEPVEAPVEEVEELSDGDEI